MKHLECRKYYICRWITLRAYNYLQKYEMKNGFNKWVAGVCVRFDPVNDNGLFANHYFQNGGIEDFW